MPRLQSAACDFADVMRWGSRIPTEPTQSFRAHNTCRFRVSQNKPNHSALGAGSVFDPVRGPIVKFEPKFQKTLLNSDAAGTYNIWIAQNLMCARIGSEVDEKVVNPSSCSRGACSPFAREARSKRPSDTEENQLFTRSGPRTFLRHQNPGAPKAPERNEPNGTIEPSSHKYLYNSHLQCFTRWLHVIPKARTNPFKPTDQSSALRPQRLRNVPRGTLRKR
jgi:hypothetical protein